MLRRAGLAVIATIFFTGLHLLQVWLDEQRATTPKSQEFMYLPSGEHLKLVSLGYDDVVADLLWLEAIQAMGERKFSEAAGHWVGHVLDVVTTLDPQFVRVYEAGGVALVTLTQLPEESNRLLEKGMANNPEVWRLPFLLGFNYYFEYDDNRKAASYIAHASRLQGAPPYLTGLAARLYVSIRNPKMALQFLSEAYGQTKDENVRSILEQRMKQVVVERDLVILEDAIKRYHEDFGAPPKRLEDLVGRGLLLKLPQEPFGGRYLYDASTLNVRSSAMPERMQPYGHRRHR